MSFFKKIFSSDKKEQSISDQEKQILDKGLEQSKTSFFSKLTKAVAGKSKVDDAVSWEGHLMGFVVGIILAFYYRKEGPQRPKYDYEIEKELGIEPPDLEGIYLEQQRIANEQEQALDKDSGEEQRIKIFYDYKKDLDK